MVHPRPRFDDLYKGEHTVKQILLISTGGTIGMQVADEGNLDSHHFIQEIFQYAPEISAFAELEVVHPFTMDSSELGLSEWQTLGHLIYEGMDQYDGFVVIHGTDTMSYTACALSYMLANVTKPVIITGSQRPLAALRTDARANLVGAIELATKPITEVCIYFDNKLFRGNRTKKSSIDEFDAFISPNYPPLATVGINIERVAPFRSPTGLPRLESTFDSRVASLRIFPAMNISFWTGLLESEIQVLILEAFGAGNIPALQTDVVDFIRAFTEQGKLVVICSQAPEGTCDLTLYGGGQAALQAGAQSAGDMTFEATVVKAMFLLGLFKGNIEKVRHGFSFSIAGEISDQRVNQLV